MAVNPMELRDTVLRITGVNPRKCMKCGKCSGTCPAYDQMEYHPHQFVAMVEKGDIERLMASPSVFMPELLRLRGALPARRGARQAD